VPELGLRPVEAERGIFLNVNHSDEEEDAVHEAAHANGADK
jgi:hypothetical protein